MSPPTVDQFFNEISQIVSSKDGAKLQSCLVIEPPFPPLYAKLVQELRQAYPNANSNTPLENKIKTFISEYDDSEDGIGASRLSFIAFLVRYATTLRDLNVDNLVETHELLRSLLNQSILALGSIVGLTILPTVVSLCKTLAKLAIGLDRRPDLVIPLMQRRSAEEAEERITLVESTANTIREAFKKCLSERGGTSPSGIDTHGRPEGRRIGIYTTANLCLKLFFHCKKLRSAEQIFGNIYQQSPPLALFPASQRVTYLYYLGRYHFANGHCLHAQAALQAAYNQCHRSSHRNRRLILIYLLSANIILGRFPSAHLYTRATPDIYTNFQPLCTAIAHGNLSTFRTQLDITRPSSIWFLRYRLLLQLLDRAEVLVWRSLARRTFLIAGSQGDATSRKAPTMQLQDMLTLALLLDSAASTSSQQNYIDPEFDQPDGPSHNQTMTMATIESQAASLIEQGFLHGFISHASHRFAITGAKNASALLVGFPAVWSVIRSKQKPDGAVPGWVISDPRVAKVAGSVVRLNGARPISAV